MTPAQPSAETVEAVARAICRSRDLSPDTLYQHNFEGDWPEDDRREYRDPFTGEPRVMLFHRAWRRFEKAAIAAIEALAHSTPPASDVIERAVAAERERCARMARSWAKHWKGWQDDPCAADDLSAAIRRPQQPARDEEK